MASLLNLPEIPDRQHISLAQNQSSPSVPFQKRTLFERSTTLRDDRCCSHAYMLPRYEHTHFLPQYWSGQNRTSRTACAGPGHIVYSTVGREGFCLISLIIPSKLCTVIHRYPNHIIVTTCTRYLCSTKF